MPNLFNLIFITLFTNVLSPPPPVTLSNEGGYCGGMMPPEMIHTCKKPLECVYTNGPMIADAPGVWSRVERNTSRV